MADTINPLDELLPVIAAAVAEWKVDNTPEKIKERVQKHLTKSGEEITLKLLGFNKDTWRESAWELDHCNGRSGNSAAGDYLRKQQQVAIQEWLSTVTLPPLSAKAQKDMVNEYISDYKTEMRSILRRKACEQASEHANELISKVVASNNLANHLKVMQLIDPEHHVGHD